MRGKGWAGKGARNKVGEGAGEDWQRVGERSQLAQALAKPLSAPPARAPSDLITPQKCVLICMRKRPQLPNGAGLGSKSPRQGPRQEDGEKTRGHAGDPCIPGFPFSAPPARAPSDLITPQKCVLSCMRKRPQLPNGAGLRANRRRCGRRRPWQGGDENRVGHALACAFCHSSRCVRCSAAPLCTPAHAHTQPLGPAANEKVTSEESG